MMISPVTKIPGITAVKPSWRRGIVAGVTALRGRFAIASSVCHTVRYHGRGRFTHATCSRIAHGVGRGILRPLCIMSITGRVFRDGRRIHLTERCWRWSFTRWRRIASWVSGCCPRPPVTFRFGRDEKTVFAYIYLVNCRYQVRCCSLLVYGSLSFVFLVRALTSTAEVTTVQYFIEPTSACGRFWIQIPL